MHAAPTIKHLIVDSSPLLTAPLSSLRGMAQSYLVTPDVVSELRDKKGREVMREAELYLGVPGEGGLEGGRGGFSIREPTAEAVAKGEFIIIVRCIIPHADEVAGTVTSFARKTGDIAVLSLADIRVLALCLTLELEENGSWRVRDTPGQVLAGKPPGEEGEEESVEELANKIKRIAIAPSTGAWGNPAPLPLVAPVVVEEPIASTSTSTPFVEESPVVEESVGTPAEADEGDDVIDSDVSDDESEADSDDSHSSSSSWITPDNLLAHRNKDLGLFTAPTTEELAAKPPKSIMKAAVLTGDFAMQNVALQMGLNVLGSGGKRVREVRTWVLRCHGCFKSVQSVLLPERSLMTIDRICKNPEKRFCPSCGAPTLIRTSITYVTATPENPKGYILHLKANFQYRLRGTQYSIPNPKMGKAGGGVHAEQVLREDQKEWVRGVKTAEHVRSKETRAILRAVMDEKDRGARGAGERAKTGTVGGMGGWNDPDWQPAMNLGETKGRRKGGKNGAGGEVRLDKSGMPLLGSGKRNINDSRKKH